MVNTCEPYGLEFGMDDNAAKSMCVRFSRKKKPTPDIKLNGNSLPWVDCVKHLGNYLTYDLSDTHEIRVKKG